MNPDKRCGILTVAVMVAWNLRNLCSFVTVDITTGVTTGHDKSDGLRGAIDLSLKLIDEIAVTVKIDVAETWHLKTLKVGESRSRTATGEP